VNLQVKMIVFYTSNMICVIINNRACDGQDSDENFDMIYLLVDSDIDN
jgi:hypothetical protein